MSQRPSIVLRFRTPAQIDRFYTSAQKSRFASITGWILWVLEKHVREETRSSPVSPTKEKQTP